MNEIAEKLAKNTGFNFITRNVNFICRMTLSIIVARMLGPNRLGSYALVAWTLGVAQLLINLGLNTTATKYIAECAGGTIRKTTISDIFSAMLKIRLPLTFGAVSLMIIVAPFFARFYDNLQLKSYVIISACILVPYGISSLLDGVIQGIQKYEYLAVGTLIAAPLSLLLSGVALWLGYGIVGLLIVTLIIDFLRLIVYLFLLRRYITLKFRWTSHFPVEVKDRIRRYGLHVAIILFVDMIVWERSEVFFLGHFRGASEVGFYSLAYGITERVMTVLPILSGVLMPMVSQLHGSNDKYNLQKLYLTSTRYLIFIAVPFSVGGILLSNPLVQLLYGKEYLPAALILKILLVSRCASVIAIASASIQYGTEHQDFILKWGSVLAGGNLLMDIILIPRFGAIGAAIANSSAQLIGFLIGAIAVCHQLKVRFPVLHLVKVLTASLAMIPCILIIRPHAFGGIMLSVLVGAVICFAAIFLLRAFTKQDIILLTSLKQKLLASVMQSKV